MTTFEAFHEPSSAKVRVEFGPHGLVLRDADGLLVALWLYADLRPLGELRPGQALVITSTADPDGRLTLIDSAILEGLRLRAPQAVQGRSGGDSLLQGCAVGTLAGCGGGCVLLIAIPVLLVLGALAWLGLPAWWDDRPLPEHMAERLYDWMEPAPDDALPPACTGAEGQARLDRLATRLAEAGGLDDAPAVAVLDHDEPLAFPIGRRGLYVTRGLVERLDDGDMLAGVLAHIMGHAAQGDRLPVEAARKDGLWRLSVPSCTAEADELEADGWALRALSRAGLRADGLRRHLDRLPRGMVGDWGDQLCLHPVTDERLRALRLSTPDDGAPALTVPQWQAVQGICADD